MNTTTKALLKRLGIKAKKNGELVYKSSPLKIKGMPVVLPNDDAPDKKGTIKFSPQSERDAIAASPVHKMLSLIASEVLTKEYEAYIKASLLGGSMGGRSSTALPKWAKAITLSKSGIGSFMTLLRKRWGGVIVGPQAGKGVLLTVGAGLSVYDEWGKNAPIVEAMLKDDKFIVSEALVSGKVVPITNALITLLNDSPGNKSGITIETFTRKGPPVPGNTGSSERENTPPRPHKPAKAPTAPTVVDQGPPWATEEAQVEAPQQAPVQAPAPIEPQPPQVETYTLADGTVITADGGTFPQQPMGMPMQMGMGMQQPMGMSPMGMQQPMGMQPMGMQPMQQQLDMYGNPMAMQQQDMYGWPNGMM